MVATGVGYEGVKQGAFHHRAAAIPVAAKTHRVPAKPPAAAAAVIPAVQEPAHDQKPFRRAGGHGAPANRAVTSPARPALGTPKPKRTRRSACSRPHASAATT